MPRFFKSGAFRIPSSVESIRWTSNAPLGRSPQAVGIQKLFSETQGGTTIRAKNGSRWKDALIFLGKELFLILLFILPAAEFDDTASGTPKSNFVRIQFGASAGGGIKKTKPLPWLSWHDVFQREKYLQMGWAICPYAREPYLRGLRIWRL
jgi:hypothetical protein